MEFLSGHALGHMCALARTSERSFVLLGADACHFAGALRSSRYLPMPDTLDAEASRLDLRVSRTSFCVGYSENVI